MQAIDQAPASPGSSGRQRGEQRAASHISQQARERSRREHEEEKISAEERWCAETPLRYFRPQCRCRTDIWARRHGGTAARRHGGGDDTASSGWWRSGVSGLAVTGDLTYRGQWRPSLSLLAAPWQ